jgi:transcription antitermination factor NusG
LSNRNFERIASEINSQETAWFVLRITYNRALKCKEYLDDKSIKNFIPMHYVTDAKEGKKRKLVPVINSLIFVYTHRFIIDQIRQDPKISSLVRYMMDKSTGKPIVVPNKQMQDFIAVAGANNEQILYLNPSELPLKRGDKVRITKGVWTGVEGEFLRVKGDRRVVVIIRGIMAVATVFIHPSWLEVLKPD